MYYQTKQERDTSKGKETTTNGDKQNVGQYILKFDCYFYVLHMCNNFYM